VATRQTRSCVRRKVQVLCPAIRVALDGLGTSPPRAVAEGVLDGGAVWVSTVEVRRTREVTLPRLPAPSGFAGTSSRLHSRYHIAIQYEPLKLAAVGAGEASGAAMKRSLKPLSVLLPTKIPCPETSRRRDHRCISTGKEP